MVFVLTLAASAEIRANFQTIVSGGDQSAAVDRFIAEQMRQFHIPGLSLAVVRDGKTIKTQGYGLANVELKAAASPSTVYEIGSITKQFTATAVVMLAEENKIKLDAPIGDYLADIPAAWKMVTVRQLLNQTSGIREYFNDDVPDLLKAAHYPATKEQILKPATDAPLNFQPGESYNYSNTNYYLLGLIMEKTSGATYGDFLRARIFAPLGMTATRFNDHRIVIENRAAGYDWD